MFRNIVDFIEGRTITESSIQSISPYERFKDTLLDLDIPNDIGITYMPERDLSLAADNFNRNKPWSLFRTIDGIDIHNISDNLHDISLEDSTTIKNGNKKINRLFHAKDYFEQNIFDNTELIKQLQSESAIKSRGNATNFTLDWVLVYFFAVLDPEIIFDYLNQSLKIKLDFDEVPVWTNKLNPNKSGFSLPKERAITLSIEEITRFQKALKNRNNRTNRDIIIVNADSIYQAFLQFSEAFIYDLEEHYSNEELHEAEPAYHAARIISLKKSRRLILYIFPELLVTERNTLSGYFQTLSEILGHVDLIGVKHEQTDPIKPYQANLAHLLNNKRILIELYAYQTAFNLPNILVGGTIYQILMTEDIASKEDPILDTVQYLIIDSLTRVISQMLNSEELKMEMDIELENL